MLLNGLKQFLNNGKKINTYNIIKLSIKILILKEKIQFVCYSNMTIYY